MVRDIPVYEELEMFFKDHGYTWNFNGDYREPTAKEIEETVDKAATALYRRNAGSFFEAGRLIIVKHENGRFGIYPLLGEVK